MSRLDQSASSRAPVSRLRRRARREATAKRAHAARAPSRSGNRLPARFGEHVDVAGEGGVVAQRGDEIGPRDNQDIGVRVGDHLTGLAEPLIVSARTSNRPGSTVSTRTTSERRRTAIPAPAQTDAYAPPGAGRAARSRGRRSPSSGSGAPPPARATSASAPGPRPCTA